MNLSLVLSTQQAQFNAVAFKGDLEQNVAKIAAWGYDGVELAIRDPRLVDVAEIERIFAQHSVTMPAIGTGQAWGEERLNFPDPDPAVRRAAIERIKSQIPVAAHFGAVIIIGLVRGIVQPGMSQETALALVVEAFKECTAAAAEEDVRIAIEPINRYETTLINNTAEGLELLDKVGAENMGLLLDTFHMNIEDASIEGSIRAAGDRIFHFHVADSNRWYPGAGHIDFPSVFDALFAGGYDGYVSGEFMPLPDGDTAAERAIAYLKGI